MSIINLEPPPQLDPLAAGVLLHLTSIDAQFRSLNALYSNIASFIWANPQYTPQQVVAAFGRKAGELFRLSGLLTPLIGGITGVAPNPIPEGWTFTVNEDGTVTVTRASHT